MKNKIHLWRIYTPAVFLIAISAFIQTTELIPIFGIKPNLVFVSLITLIPVTPHFFGYALLTCFGAALLRFSPGVEREIIVLVLLALTLFLLKKVLPGNHFLNMFFLVSIGTALFYLIADVGFLLHNPLIILFEIAYNAVIGILFYIVVEKFIAYG